MTLKSVKTELLGFSKTELRELQKVIALLLNERAAPEQQGSDISRAASVLVRVQAALPDHRAVPIEVLRKQDPKTYKLAQTTAEHLETLLTAIAKQERMHVTSLHREKFTLLFVWQAIAYIEQRLPTVPLSMRTVLQQYVRAYDLIAAAFPGYLAAGCFFRLVLAPRELRE